MIVVADTSPLNYLILIDQAHLLPALFGEVLIPPAVLQELHHPKTPDKIKDWIAQPPAWLQIRKIQASPPAALMILDSGEREAIQLAIEINAKIVLVDDAQGRSARHAWNFGAGEPPENDQPKAIHCKARAHELPHFSRIAGCSSQAEFLGNGPFATLGTSAHEHHAGA
jgi:predicted nucleic acid-binding protein